MRKSPTDSAPRSTAIGISSSISTLACRWTTVPSRGLRGHVADRRQPLRARAVDVGARLVAPQRLGVGIEDHLAAEAVDDHRHPRPDLVPEPLDADDVGAAPARAPRSRCARCARPPRCRSRPPRRAPAARRRPATARAPTAMLPLGASSAEADSRAPDQRAQQALADQRDVALAVAEVRVLDASRTPPGSGRAPCAPPTRPPSSPRGSCGGRARPGGRPTASAGAPRGCGTGARRPRARRQLGLDARQLRRRCRASACSKRWISASTCSAAMRRSWMSTRLARTCATPMAMPGDAPTPTSRSTSGQPPSRRHQDRPLRRTRCRRDRPARRPRPRRRPPRTPPSSSPRARPPGSAGP